MIEISPNFHIGNYHSLQSIDSINIIINCGNTVDFLNYLDHAQISIPSNIQLLSLDPCHIATSDTSEFIKVYKKRLINYINSFYYLANKINFNFDFELFNNPILSGSNLKANFLNLINLINLFKLNNLNTKVLVVSPNGQSNLVIGLASCYLINTYNYSMHSSLNFLNKIDPNLLLNFSYYDDLLIVESLKKFYQENGLRKLENKAYLYLHSELKRTECMSHDDEPRAKRVVSHYRV